jgi:ATPase subunit of ABC transporter with duplicated ATPase domains
MSTNKPILSVTDISKNYDQFVVLKHIYFSIQKGEKIGLVGPNGSGKTTLFKIITGLIEKDVGIVTLSKSCSVGYIPQEFGEYKDATVRDFIGSQEYGAFLKQVGLDEAIFSRKISELSGGERTKVGLLRILVAKQDLLLLDEPTNNLDLEALTFLEEYVKKSEKTFIIISHDRRFLDETVHKIFEIDEWSRGLKIYEGGFSSYVIEREKNIENAWADYADKAEEEGRLLKSYNDKVQNIRDLEQVRLNNRYINPKEKEKPDDAAIRDKEAKAGRRARVMKDRIEKYKDDMSHVEKPKQPLPLRVEFDVPERSGDKVFDIIGATKQMPTKILGPLNYSIRYGDRVLVRGLNGSGKTTFIKMLIGELEPDTGIVEMGFTVRLGYLPQQQDFVSENTVREEFLRNVIDMEEGIGRRLLNRFRLSANDVDKKISELSSGERSRLILAILMARKVNCLVLDEPSNHLDLEVLESLEHALSQFKGTLVVVSHDRFFIEKIACSKEISF